MRRPPRAPSRLQPFPDHSVTWDLVCLWGTAHQAGKARRCAFLSPLSLTMTPGPRSHPDKCPPQCHQGLFLHHPATSVLHRPSPSFTWATGVASWPLALALLLGTVTVL